MSEHDSAQIDRQTIRRRPAGLPLMRQWWGKLLFMHWPVEPRALRPLIPAQLAVDTFEGRAWLGVVPFTMWGVRASFLPPLPGTSVFHELNVRTYVQHQGTPGVWFFSLDAANRLAVWVARRFFHLPYFDARMSLRQTGRIIEYESQRTHRDAPPAEFSANWTIGEPLPTARPDSLAFFLTERYCLYAAEGERLYRSRIWHEPWPLRAAELLSHRSTMLEAQGLAAPSGAPLLHYAERLKVDIWPLARVRSRLREGAAEAARLSHPNPLISSVFGAAP